MKTLRFIAATALAFMLALAPTAAQQITVGGTVTDKDNNPMAGVSIVVKNSSRGAVTDEKGIYSIAAAKGETLVFSYIGYESTEKEVTGPKLDVKMTATTLSIDEVVVVGHHTVNRQTFTGSASIVYCDDMAVRGTGRKTRQSQKAMAPNRIANENVAYFSSYPADMYNDAGGEQYGTWRENRFVNASKDPLSTFALEVDGAAYSNMRRMVNGGHAPEKDAVRVEEFINYFSYNYEKPQGNDPLKISYEVAPCPWNTAHKLVRIGVKAKEIPSEKLPPANFVFLVDVSGSMYGANRLPLVKSSLKLLVNNLRDEDRVAIVAYAGAAGEVLPSTPGSDKQKIREALDNLIAGGSTAGGAGIKLAYGIARKNFKEGGNNRIILCTDGDFNVGVSSSEGLESLIEKERKSGVFLTVLGYGMGNYKDKNLQTLAEKGNGNFGYIDNLQEANKVLVNEFGGTMYTVAKDVKLQVEFNPARVQSFRLVGYESRLLGHEDFNDDTKDAGEIGAGHSVTALYEVVPVGAKSPIGSIDPLKYQTHNASERPAAGSKFPDLMTVKLRYKDPDGTKSKLMEVPVIENGRRPSEDFHFASAVAMFGQLLRDSDFKGDATYDMVLSTARRGLGNDPHGYRREFVRLAETVKSMTPAEHSDR